MGRPTIAETALAVLAEAGPLQAAELGRRVAGLGATRSKNPTAAVTQALAAEARAARLLDGRFALTVVALDGLVLTHRLTLDEAVSQCVQLEPDLGPIGALARDGLRLASGGELERPEPTLLRGPDGWLSPARPGDLVAFRLRDGQVRIDPVELPTDRAAGKEVLAVIEADLDCSRGVPVLIGPTIREAAVLIPGLLRAPVAPIGELLTAAGLVVRGNRAYLPDTRAGAVPAARHRGLPPSLASAPPLGGLDHLSITGLPNLQEALAQRIVERVASQFGVDTQAVDGVGLLIQASEMTRDDPQAAARLDGEQGLFAELAGLLAQPGVAELARLATMAEPAATELLLTQLAGAVKAPLTAAPTWLLGRLAEARGEALAAEVLDLRALRADPTFVPALLDIARAAEDRGDARLAAQLLTRAGVKADHPHMRRLWSYVNAAVIEAAVTESAVTESAESLDDELARLLATERTEGPADLEWSRFPLTVAPLTVRTGWLLDKALGWALLPMNRPAIGHLPAFLADPLVGILAKDTILFDRGMLARYLRLRAQILPPDEFELGRDWLVTERALWEVEASHPTGHIVLRNARAGELAEITAKQNSILFERGSLFYGRIVPDGRDRLLLDSGFPIPRQLRSAFVTLLSHQLDGAAVIAWFEEVRRNRLDEYGV